MGGLAEPSLLCAATSPISSPTATRPLAMPTRAAGASPVGACSWPIVPARAKPARTRPLGLDFVRGWLAEIGAHAVADGLGDVALKPPDDLGASRLIGPHHVAQVLGIEPGAP
jgi:hypothetical protein